MFAYPVYEKTVDHVVGILIAKHLLRELVDNPDVQLKDLMLEPFDAFDYDYYTMMVKEVDENHRITRLLILDHKPKDEE